MVECAIIVILFVGLQGKVGGVHTQPQTRQKTKRTYTLEPYPPLRIANIHKAVEISVEWNDHRQLQDAFRSEQRREGKVGKQGVDLNDMHVCSRTRVFLTPLFYRNTTRSLGCDW